MPANNDVLQGIDKVNQYFRNNQIKISKKCVSLIRELGEYKWKELKPGSVRNEYEEPQKVNDHACDSLRYMINYIYAPVKKVEVKSGYREREGVGEYNESLRSNPLDYAEY